MNESQLLLNRYSRNFPLWKTLLPWSPPLPFLPLKHQIKTSPSEEISLSKLSPWKSSHTAENKRHTEISTVFTLTINPRPSCVSSKWQLKHFQILCNLLRQIQIVKTVQKAGRIQAFSFLLKETGFFLLQANSQVKAPL